MSPETPIATCAVDEEVDKDLFYGPFFGDGLRFLVLSLSDSSTLLPKHVRYRCEVDIAPNARVGIYPVTMTNTAGADPLGNAKTITAIDGAIRVMATDATGLNFLPDADWDADNPDAAAAAGAPGVPATAAPSRPA